MLGKLLKHEFRATAMPVLLLCLSMLAVSGVTRLCMLLAEIWEFFTLIASIAATVYVIGLIAAYIFIFVLIVRRFYVNIYGAEGYITLTLPAARWKIILSKLLVALVWAAAGAVVTILSLLIIASYPQFFRDFGYMFREITQTLGYGLRFLNMPLPLLIAEIILTMIVGAFGGILMLYASVSIGQLFRKHRIIGSVAGYMMLYAANQLIMSIYTVVAGLTIEGIGSSFGVYRQVLDGMSVFQLQVLVILYLLINVMFTLGYYLVTLTVMKKAVNLQ